MERTNKALQNHKKQNDEILEDIITKFPPWQLKISILMSLLKFPIAWFTLSIVFLAPPTQFWCTPPPTHRNLSLEKWLNISQELHFTQESLNSGSCKMVELESNETIPCKFGYSYNNSMFDSTIISEWDLVCGRGRLIDLSQATLMLGVLMGNILFGILADRYGRKLIIMLCITFQALFGIAASFAPNYWLFILLRSLVAITNGGTMVTSFVMCMEAVEDRWRAVIPILYQIPFGFGNTIMAIVAYFVRDWRYLHFILSVLCSLFILYYWYIQESPRWLLATGQKTEAISTIKKIAGQYNVDQKELRNYVTGLSNINFVRVPGSSIGGIFSTGELKKRNTLLCLNWMFSGITFYAFSQYLGQIGTNIFLTVATSGLVALPGTIACIFLVGKYGRRWTIASSYLFTASCFLFISLTPKGYFNNDWLRVVLSGFGIIGISVSTPALYLFTGELYPTVLRNAGVGMCLMCSRVGSMFAPFLITLEEKETALPLIILTSITLVQVALVLPLQETKNLKLLETVQDLEKI
ncbi:solute carrier family 22 member 3-like [Diabrotica undecimpunctata]|uniref:solute carrier family 22 member 3-like n=1 Tax=Diabrotica undecimpunctata TaxID=50387 RepID=UPI003B635961